MKIVKKPAKAVELKKHGCKKSDNHPNCQSKRGN